jgi:dipeptidyl aminopeptidase/acylaminoacyl peptidase
LLSELRFWGEKMNSFRWLASLGLLLTVGQGMAVAQSQDAPSIRPSAAPRTPVPLAAFARLPETDRPRLSTDGTALAAKIRHNGEQYLAIVPLDRPNARPEIIARDGDIDQRSDVRITNWQWVDADNLLIWVASQIELTGAGQRVEATRVVAYNRRTRRTTPLGWRGTFVRGGRVLWISNDGPPRIRLARLAEGAGYERINHEEVIEVDVNTGQQELIEPRRRGVTTWHADGEGNIRLGTSFDNDSGRLQALYRRGGSGNFDTIIRERQERYGQAHVPQIFLPGEKALVLSRDSGFSAVYEMDLRTMELGRRVFGVDGYDVAAVDANDEGNALERAIVVRDRAEHHWFTPRMREVQSVLDETFGPHNALVASADRARQTFVIHVAAPNQAGAYYLYRTSTGSLVNIGWRNNELRDMALNPVRTIRYRASDGQNISAVLTLPRLREGRNLPLIVLPHGGPWARDEEGFDMWAQPLAEMGYAVVQPNFRGSSGFGQAWEAMSDGNWGERMSDDLNDAITHLASQGIADPRRVCIFGWSYGGYAASRAAQRDPDKYRCAISGAGVHDIPDMVAYDREYLGRYGSRYIGSAASRLAEVSAARHTSGRWAPILIVHGARDQRVPVSQSRNLVSRLRSAGKVEGRDFVYVEQPLNTHNLQREEDRIQLLQEAQRFLARHNPPD